MASMRVRRIGALLSATLVVPLAAGQSEAPSLTRQQRATLQALVQAVETRNAEIEVSEADWPLHILRASDGSHYVAFSLHHAPGVTADRELAVYVRLATRQRGSATGAAERSAVAEWLAGQTPAPVLPRRGLAFGEMPIYGAAGIAVRGAVQQAQNLQILELERERAREKREAQERARKAALEGTESARATRPLLPFEDFDFHARASTAVGRPILRRSLTTGPGEYELVIAWTDPAEPKPSLHVARRVVTFPPASTTALSLSSVILADDVSIRETPIPPTEQASRPYSIGGTEIIPATDYVLTPDERLALLVQVINARGNPAGKPDVEVGFRLFRRDRDREENIGALAPQQYNELTLPGDFDISKGHPLFAAVAIPLRSFKRGEYRIEISANDRIAGAGILTDATFTVTATAAALLREAPPLAPAFDPAKESLTTAVPVIRGGVHASDGNDREAVIAWQAAIDGGVPTTVVWPLMIDALLRLGDSTRAVELARRALDSAPDNARAIRQLSAALILGQQRSEALRLLDQYLVQKPDDRDAQWLALHALFADFVATGGTKATTEQQTRITDLAKRYAAAGGPHARLAADWAAAVR